MPDEQDLQAKRRAAQLAMEGDFWQKKRQEKEELVSKRRLEAQKAMESPERKQRRRDEELEVKRAAEAAAQAEAAKKAEAEAEANKAKSIAADAAKQAAAREARFGKIAAAEKQVSQMAQAPADTPSSLHTVRTLKTDIAEASERRQVSLASIAIKEAEKKRSLPTAELAAVPTRRGHGFLIFLLVLMILAGLGTLGYTWWLKNGNPFAPIEIPATSTTTPPLIFAERQTTIEIPASTTATELRTKFMEVVAALDRQAPSIEQVNFEKNGRILNLGAWQTELKLELPAELLEALGREAMLGVYYPRTGERGAPFLILTTANYERAFAALKKNESQLTQPLAILNIAQAPIIESGSSTPAVLGWSDRSIYNADVRVWPLPGATSGLFYTFLNRATIALTPNQETLVEIITRFRTAN